MYERCNVGKRVLLGLCEVGRGELKYRSDIFNLRIRLLLLETAKRADARRENRL